MHCVDKVLPNQLRMQLKCKQHQIYMLIDKMDTMKLSHWINEANTSVNHKALYMQIYNNHIKKAINLYLYESDIELYHLFYASFISVNVVLPCLMNLHRHFLELKPQGLWQHGETTDEGSWSTKISFFHLQSEGVELAFPREDFITTFCRIYKNA